eukprot:TRINITY_DN66944_c0_g1_i1.p1 TRINITY_DN66944_c0_g1~~TRINITY_DN66944_c0_g1_i1.p1  ORF type:complete len:402 (-),score=73.65 TRINITY_DN66944_c0_g1_i1:22-1227(-)
MDVQPSIKGRVVFAFEWTNVLFPHTWLEDLLQTRKVPSGDRFFKIHEFIESEFLSDDSKADSSIRLTKEETLMYRTCQAEVKKTLAMCRKLGKVRVITTLRGGADLHEEFACKVEDEFFEQWTDMEPTEDALSIMGEKGKQRKFQESEFSHLISEALCPAGAGQSPDHFVSVGSDINYRNATFACKPRAPHTIYHAVHMGDHQYDLGYRTLGFFRDRNIVSCATMIEHHRSLQKHLMTVIYGGLSAKVAEDFHLDVRKGVSIFFQRDLRKLDAYLDSIGRSRDEDLPTITHGKDSVDFVLSLADNVPKIDMNFAVSSLPECIRQSKRQADVAPCGLTEASSGVVAGSVARPSGPDAEKKRVSFTETAGSVEPAPPAVEEDPAAAEERRRIMREARLKRLSQ